tara:strand:+ start:113 stop:1021 length:909 start_codon:yes stop_codon:yes gene_type:complete
MKSLLPDGVDLQDLLNQLRPLCWGAADILMAYARNEQPPFGFSKVLDVHDTLGGPVSAADLAVNSWLMQGLNSNFPSVDWYLLSEETAKENEVARKSISSDWLWILDPLDGTKDFLKGSGEYAVHLALVKDHRPLLGVVLIPELEELWFGIVGNGAWSENRIGQKNFVRFSNRKELDQMVLVCSRSHREANLEKLIQKLDVGAEKSVGSIGCKIGTILRGESDIYLSLSGKTAPKDWDMAAPEAVLLAAGGQFTHADLAPLTYNKEDFCQSGCLIASNGNNHELLCEKTLNELSIIDSDFLV